MGYGKTALLFFLLSYTDADLKMTGPSAYTATLGSDAHIPCAFTADQRPKDSKPFTVLWYYNRISILNSYEPEAESRYSLNIDELLSGNANLIISNMSVADGGSYTCAVSYEHYREEKEITVTIQAVPKITIVNDVVMIHNESFLCCEISGFYPVNISIKWLRDGEILDNVLEGKPQENPDGSYNVYSAIILKPTEEDKERNFSCRVQHVSLLTPLDKDFRLVYEDEKVSCVNPCECNISATIILGCLFGVSIIIIIYCGWRKKQRDSTSSVPANNKEDNELNVEEENSTEDREESQRLRPEQNLSH